MKRFFVFALILIAGSGSGMLYAAPHHSHANRRAETLVQAEYAFARAVKQHGLRDGFLTFMDPQAIAFTPRPMSAQAFYSSRDPGPSSLVWHPVMARVAASGDFGFTSGPWQVDYTDQFGKAAIMHGDYATLWHRTRDGKWRWLLDAGVAHPMPSPPAKALPDSATLKPYRLRGTSRGSTSGDTLASLDVKYSKLAADAGMRAAFQQLGAPDMRLLQFNSAPLKGRAAIVKQTPMLKARLKWISSGSGSASSGDLAYTYGMAYPLNKKMGTSPESVYLHIWQHTRHGWRLLLDLENALPPSHHP